MLCANILFEPQLEKAHKKTLIISGFTFTDQLICVSSNYLHRMWNDQTFHFHYGTFRSGAIPAIFTCQVDQLELFKIFFRQIVYDGITASAFDCNKFVHNFSPFFP
jgi:hypothetical protein